MKKKLVSILLSLSMCATYATPLMTVAADKAPAEDVTVVESVSPNAELTPTTTSPNAFKLTTSGSNITMEYGDELVVSNYSYFAVGGNWANGSGAVDSDKATEATPTLTLAKSNDVKFLTVNGNKITAENITKGTVPVIVHLDATGDPAEGSKKESAELKLNITVTPKDLSKASEIKAAYSKETEGKTYNSLDDFVKKYKGAKGFTAEVTMGNGQKKTLAKADMAKISAFVDTNEAEPQKLGTTTVHYYTAKNGLANITGGAIVTTAGIKVEGKGNFKGSFTITGQPVSLQPQRLNANDVGTISGTTVTFGSITVENLIKGLTVDDYKALGDDVTAINKLYKFTPSKDSNRRIKVDMKKGMVTVKAVPEKESDRFAEITITNKKNKLCVGKVKFDLAPQNISDSAFTVDLEKVIGKADKPKTYKNFVDFKNKFDGKGAKSKASGLAFNYLDSDNMTKPIRLKVNKDFEAFLTIDGTISGAPKKGNLEPTAYLKGADVATCATIVIKGIGNYTGVHTESAVCVPMEIQTITAAGVAYDGTATVTYSSLSVVNIYDCISIDNAMKNNNPVKLSDMTEKDELIKAIKVKPEKDSGLKLDKEGNIIVKKVPASGKGKIIVSSKKNNKSVDAYHEFEFNIMPIDATEAGVKINTDSVEGKTFNNAAAAKKAIEKVPVVVSDSGKDKKLKFGTDKDYSSFTVKQVEPDNHSTESTATGPALCYEVSAKLANNYSGNVTTYVNCTAKK
jgi:hypothetical protein